MSASPKVSRRDFLRLSAASGAALVLGFHLPAGRLSAAALLDPNAQTTGDFEPNAYIVIDTSGIVTLRIHRSEMGQSIQTAITMILAEDLEADWSKIRIEQAPADRVYGDQVTGGSVSLSGSFLTLRVAGTAARVTLVNAAAQIWDVSADECYAENGAVIYRPDGKSLPYGDLVEVASQLEVPRADLPIKTQEEFHIIGTRIGQLTEPDMVTGRAIYGSDVKLPGMLYATIARCPVFGGKLATFDASAAEAVPGVRQVIETNNGVAVLADNTWAAIQGRDLLDITWDEGSFADLDSDAINTMLTERVEQIAGEPVDQEGTVTRLEAVYETGYFAHANMEPMNCTADMRQDGGDVWAPTQDRQGARGAAGGRANIHVPMIGTGMGRRLQNDYVTEAVRLSQAVGAPVKVVWTREDDFQHDFYQSPSRHIMRAALDAAGMPLLIEHYAVGQENLPYGVRNPYTIRQNARSGGLSGLPIPLGAWRSVSNHQNAFANECFIDELAAAAGKDPYAFRMELLGDRSPIKPVLQLAAEQAGWDRPLPDNWARGIACHSTFDVTPVVYVVEVSRNDNDIRVERVICAVDCGLVINPDGVEAQMEGGIVFGLTAALKQEITLQNGRVEQENFRAYRLLRMDEMPVVKVHILPSTRTPSGVGEMGVPPIAPALANALFALTGQRARRLPIDLNTLREA